MNQAEQFHSRIIPDARLLPGVLGLRGLAALAIVFYHIVHIVGLRVPSEFDFIATDFGAGTHLFFVLSAFSLMYSTGHTMGRPSWVRCYLVKRFFRIAPLFYSVLGVMLLGRAILTPDQFPDLSVILLNLFFVFGFFPDPEIGLVMAGWTIGVEMIFYLIFPVLLMVIRTQKEAFIFVVIAVIIGLASNVMLHDLYLKMSPLPKWEWQYFAFLPNLFFFAVGMYAFRHEELLKASDKPLHSLTPWIVLLLIVIQTQPFTGSFGLLIQAAGFAVLCVWQSARPSSWIANRFVEYLGERSFSIYLLHPLVIILLKGKLVEAYAKLEPVMGAYAYFFCALLVMCVVLALAEITYRIIEVPGIKLGSKLVARLREQASHV